MPPIAGKALFLALLFAGCTGGAELFLPDDGEPAAIEVVHGHEQSGRVGEPLTDSLVFEVTDSRGRPVEGAGVVVELTASGPGTDVVPDTSRTDAIGQAFARVVLGTSTGPQQGEARLVVPDGVEAPTASFTVIALPENANGIVPLSGDNQTGPAGSVLGLPLVVEVTDAFGNPISGVPIAWTAEGGGSVSEASNVTDGEGRASVLRTLGPAAGPQATVAATDIGVAGSPVTFVHTATAGNASGLTIISGNNQTAQAGTRLPADLVVRLVDASGNGVPGAAVTWVVGTGGGSVTPENGTTDQAGQASAQWTLGPNPGSNRVDAVVSGVGVVNFLATGTANVPASLAIVTQPSPTALNGQVLDRQPVVQVRDVGGTPTATPGVAITAQLSGGGGQLLGTTQRLTDASGRATFTDLAISGAQGPRILVFTASGYAGASSAPVMVTSIPTTTTITSDSPEPSVAGAAVTVAFRVDAQGVIPTGTVTVTDGVQSCSGTLSGGSGSCQLTLNTQGQRTLRATYAGSPGLNPSSDTETHQVTPPPAGNNPPNAAYNRQCQGLTCAFTDASSDSDGRVISWSWNFGDGQTTTVREPSHTFPAPGSYTVTLTVTDDDGVSDQFSATVRVEAPPPPPPGNEPPTAAFGFSCDELTCAFDAGPSRDGDGRITRYSWTFGDGSTENDDRTPRHTYNTAGTYNVTLTVTDNDGATHSATQSVTATPPPPPDNEDPQADFEVACENLTCTFTDRSSDKDGTIVSRVWNYGDGSAPSSAPSHTYASEGRYTVTLTVTDDRGGTDTREREARPTAPPAPNQPPTASFTSSCNNLSCSFDSDGSSDGDGQIQTFAWDFGDGARSDGRNPQHTYGSANTYTVTLMVTDDDGASNSTTRQVTVSAPPPPNQAPNPQFTWSCTDLSCSFQDGSTDDRGIASRAWNFGDPASGADNTSGAQNPNHTFSAGGSFRVSLTVTDTDGESRTISHDVNVTAPPPPNQAPNPQFTWSCTDLSCSFQDGSSDDRGIATRAWNFGDPASGDNNTSSAQNPSHTFSSAGSFTVILTVTDTDGETRSVSHDVSVTAPNEPPTARIGSIFCTGMHCEYTDDSIDPQGDETIAEWSWVFDDGSGSGLQNPSHDYAAAGTYNVRLSVTDNRGAASPVPDERTITVTVPDGGGEGGGGAAPLIAKGRS